jgi:hypothetical protein
MRCIVLRCAELRCIALQDLSGTGTVIYISTQDRDVGKTFGGFLKLLEHRYSQTMIFEFASPTSSGLKLQLYRLEEFSVAKANDEAQS